MRVVGGDRVAVTTLVGPDQDAHAFEPKPSDVKTILASKLVVNNGLGFEPWAHKLVQSVGYRGPVLLASRGVNADTEPSAKQVAQLIQQIKREHIRAVFLENMSDPKLVAQLSKDAGAKVGATLFVDALSAPYKPGATYLQMMRYNVTEMVAGIKLN